MKPVIGFLLVLTGVMVVAEAFVSGNLWPQLPTGIALITTGVVLIALPERRL